MLSGANLLKHVGVPALGPGSIIALYFTPVATFGCVNRGLTAVCVMLMCAIAAVVTTWRGVHLPSGNPARSLWLLSTAILLLPAALLLGPLG